MSTYRVDLRIQLQAQQGLRSIRVKPSESREHDLSSDFTVEGEPEKVLRFPDRTPHLGSE